MASKTDRLEASVELEKQLTAIGALYEQQDTVIDGVVCRAYRHAPKSLNDIFRKALSMADSILAVFQTKRLSYREAFSDAARIAAALKSRYGIAPGTRVAIALESDTKWISAFLAVLSLGATVVLETFGIHNIFACSGT